MGHITNEHLAKLWDFMASYNCKSEEQPSDILKAFQECDEALSDVEKDRDHWKTMYGNACGDQDVLKESIRLLDTENRRLMAENKDWEKRCEGMRNRHLDAITTNDKTINQLRNIIAKDNDEMSQLRTENEDLRKDNKALELVIKRNIDDATVDKNAIYQLRKENEGLKKECKSLQGLNDDFIEKINGKDDDIEKLDHMLQNLQREYDKLKNDRDRKAEAVVKLANKRDELPEEYIKLLNNSGYFRNSRDTWRSRAKHAEAEAVELAKRRDELQEKNEDLKKKLTEANDILKKTNRDRNEWKRRALMTKLTSKVPDIKEEHTMTFTMDKADYKDLMNLLSSKAFGASPEYMRDFLTEFCGDRYFCQGCPLRFSDCDFDNMSDEEIEEPYKMAIDAQSETKKPDLIFGDIVKVPWSDDDYIFIETLTSAIRLYNVTTKKFVVVSKNEHLKRVGHIKK